MGQMKLLLLLALLIPAQDPAPKKGRFKKVYDKSYALLEVPKNWSEKKPHGLIVLLHGAGGRPENYAPIYRAALKKGFILLLPAAHPKTAEEAARST